MRWKQYVDDPKKAHALTDILLGAAMSDDVVDDDELIEVEAILLKVRGVAELEPEILHHIETFDPDALDLGAACAALELSDMKDRHDLVRCVADVIRADRHLLRAERAFTVRLAEHIGLPLADVIHLIGLPERPMTGPRPRVRPDGKRAA